MPAYGKNMQIDIHLIDGTTHSFVVDDEKEIARILDGLVPARVFANKQVMIAGNYFIAGFASDAVTRIDFITDNPPSWPYIGGLKEMVEVDEDALDRRAIPRLSDTRRSDVQHAIGEEFDTFGEFGLADGKRLCLRFGTTAAGAIEQRTRLTQLFSGPTFHVMRRDRGVILINPKHIIRWAFYPGPPEAPVTAWKAHRTELKDTWGGAPSLVFKKMDLSDAPEDEV